MRSPMGPGTFSPPSLIVFGPSTPVQTEDHLQRIRHLLLKDSRLSDFADQIRRLPHTWSTLVEVEPALSKTPGLEHLESLCLWVETGCLPSCLTAQSPASGESDSKPPNIILSPLTVIIHIVQFFEFLGPVHDSKSAPDAARRPIAVQGFCTGLLAAQTVACSSCDGEIIKNAGNALRLATAIGAFVDLNGIWRDPPLKTSCVVARWSPASGRERLEEILQQYPSAYISVVKGDSSVTITVPESVEDSLLRDARAAKLQAMRINLGGAYHTPRNKAISDALKGLCDSQSEFRLPTIVTNPDYTLPLTRERTGQNAFLTATTIEAILIERCDWEHLIATTMSSLPSGIQYTALVIGLLQCIPTTIVNVYGLEVVSATRYPNNLHLAFDDATSTAAEKETSAYSPYGDDAVAIIGMSCRFPGSDSVEQFWDILENGISTITKIPEDRWGGNGNSSRSHYGNFLREPGVFDHRFFNLSAREAAHMDPQQRLVLQVAYEAMQSSGYFRETPSGPSPVGVYMGVGAVDYQDNVGSHASGAFSAIGTLRAFITGRISHHFGWTGPSLTFDTACSSSLVAIHNACRGVVNGDCHTAVAGGVNVMTSPFLFNVLGAANFLSPNGPCKPFDDDADGYCRGEGCGLVVLKRLSHAVAAKDKILAVISSSAINQSENSTPITVPHSGSQMRLYRHVAARAGVLPANVTYLEAHGTGTAKGDPIEMASIQNVFAGTPREFPIIVGSVKGNIGHLEAASGVAALIKTVLMIQKGIIPPQANFKQLNKNIKHMDDVEVVTERRPWKAPWKAACINNYGAAGSNACILVCQPPTNGSNSRFLRSSDGNIMHTKQIFHISARTRQSLAEYCKALEGYIARSSSRLDPRFLCDLAFNLSYRNNPAHPYSVTLSTLDPRQLRSKIEGHSMHIHQSTRAPVVLCFGGQTKDYIGLSRDVYNNCDLLRHHLRHCEEVCVAMGHGPILSHVFKQEPHADLATLHCGLFAVQYSCAKAWMESGLLPDALVGHSFGQFTALCISGVLSLKETLFYLHKRAKLIQESWGPEKGAMLSVDAEKSTVDQLLTSTPGSSLNVQIACYNSQSTFVLSGSAASISALEDLINKLKAAGVEISCRMLDVTHGYHSHLVDAIVPGLLSIAKSLAFSNPNIPVELCSEHAFLEELTPERLVQHSRQPVFFTNAILRLGNRLRSACWVEAGSGSGILTLVKRNLVTQRDLSKNVYVPANLGASSDLGTISDSVALLLQSGVSVRHWAHHPLQNEQYSYLNIPPYQFEKSRHWLDYKPTAPPSSSVSQIGEKPNTSLVNLIAHLDERQSQFRISTQTEEFLACAKGHSVLGNALCPASLYMEIASRAALMMANKTENICLVPHIQELKMSAPLGVMSVLPVDLHMTRVPTHSASWVFKVVSNASASSEKWIVHAEGIISLNASTSHAIFSDKRRYQRLIGVNRCHEMFNRVDTESMQGRLIYDTFASIVNYHEHYRGVKRVSSTDNQAVGIIRLGSSEVTKRSVTHPLAIDNFLQISGLHVNILRAKEKDHLLLCTAINDIQLYKALKQGSDWTVYSTLDTTASNGIETDIYVFDSETSTLDAVLLGVQFTSVRSASLQRVLGSQSTPEHTPEHRQFAKRNSAPPARPISHQPQNPESFAEKQQSRFFNILRETIADIMQVPLGDIRDDSSLAEIGVDSLVGIELVTEISQRVNAHVSTIDISAMQSVSDLSFRIESLVAGTESGDGVASHIIPHHKPAMISVHNPKNDSRMGATKGDEFQRIAEILGIIISELLDLPATPLSYDFNLNDGGLDSLLSIDMLTEIERQLSVKLSSTQLPQASTFGDLIRLTLQHRPQGQDIATMAAPLYTPESLGPEEQSRVPISQIFSEIRESFDEFATQSQFVGFYKNVYPAQRELVLSYVVEAFRQLGCPLEDLTPKSGLLPLTYDRIHDRVYPRLLAILEDAGIIYDSPTGFLRSKKSISATSSGDLYESIIHRFPQHAVEHQLLHATGSKLAGCLSGDENPLQIIFAKNKQIASEVYSKAPMFAAATKTLAHFFSKAFEPTSHEAEPIRILEIGAGTGGTTEEIIKVLNRQGVHFEYYFTDVSQSFIAAAKRRFAQYSPKMKFVTLDIESAPPEQFHGFFHAALSSNCIHATPDLRASTSNIRTMLRPEGILCLIELTRPLFWFDLVFGLLDGWWCFTDDRNYALAHEWHWDKVLREVGFGHVDWTVGENVESTQLRLVLACNNEQGRGPSAADRLRRSKGSKAKMETIAYASQNGEDLYADIYYPVEDETRKISICEKRPVALLIHGGGHIMLSRADIPPSQINLLLEQGFLPISIDYRLCPEISLESGPMFDVVNALAWARDILPYRSLSHPYIRPDGGKVVAVGWSTGGMLALSLGWTARARGLKPPDAILSFYSPTNYADEWWTQPNFPNGTEHLAKTLRYSVTEGLRDKPITAYNVPSLADQSTSGAWMATEDARSRIALHMNWKAQTLPILMGALTSEHFRGGDKCAVEEGGDLIFPQPDQQSINRISPHAHIQLGNYRTPTCLVHGSLDDLIPVSQVHGTYEELQKAEVPSKLIVVEGAGHLFDSSSPGQVRNAVREGYMFLYSILAKEI